MTADAFSPDTLEFLFLMEKHQVQYLIVGGEAVIYYGHARLTGDIDIFYAAEPSNAARLFQTLTDFWEGDIPGVRLPEDLLEPESIFQFGVPPNRIDLMNGIDRVDFQEAWEKRETVSIAYSGKTVHCHFIGLRQLIQNKEALHRHKDFEDLKYLKKALAERSS